MQPRIDKSMQKLDEKLCCTPLEGKTYIDYDSEELRDATPHECFQGELSDLIGPWEHISAEQLDEAIRYVERNYA